MKFKKYTNLESQHAFLGASKYYWINYDEDKLIQSYNSFQATLKGTELHELAAQLIRHSQNLPKSKKTFNQYVNDAIGFKMAPEQVLYYSRNCFGTCDAISFRNDLLRIHDLKTGVTPASMKQLEIYASLFCLDYDIEPKDIDIELRIYQNNDVIVEKPDFKDILYVMNKIQRFDEIIESLREE
jgi:hypothetical protein